MSVAYGFLVLEALRGKKTFWMDPATDAAGDPAPAGDVDRDVSHVRPAG